MKRATLAIVALLAVILPMAATTTAGAQSTDEAATYTVLFRNITDGQYLTPPNFAAHTRDVDVFQLRKPASAGVQAVAENGGVSILAAELSAALRDGDLPAALIPLLYILRPVTALVDRLRSRLGRVVGRR